MQIMESKKRIALVVNSLSNGGAEKTAANLSRYLSGRYDIDLIVNDDAKPQYPYHGELFSLHMPENKPHFGNRSIYFNANQGLD